MNKIRLIFAAVMCFVTLTAVAQAPTYSTVNNNKTTERNNATWYIIKNAKTGEYLRYEGFKFSMTTSLCEILVISRCFLIPAIFGYIL